MHSQTRLLPRLDQLYLQKQSYEAHKKKLTSIRKSGSLSKRSLNHSALKDNQEDSKSIHSLGDSSLKLVQLASAEKPHLLTSEHHMQTIEEAKPGLSYWLKKMNPLQRRLKQEQIKQNKRHRQKVKNTMSFVAQSNRFDIHAQHYKGVKNMLNKFQIDHDSKKTKLKCEIVLKKITEIQKEKLKIQQSRILQFDKNQRISQKLLNMSKNTQNLPKIEDKQNDVFSVKRNRMMSQKVNLVAARQSTRTMNNTTVMKNPNPHTMRNNLVQHKDSLLTRNRSELTSKTNSLIRNAKEVKTFTPKLGNQRIKTQQILRNQPKRLFNSSKLSNLSTETAPQNKFPKDYKLLRVNFTQKGETFKRVPTEGSQNRYKNNQTDKSMIGADAKKNIASRIRTEINQKSRVQKISRQGSIKRFDYQKKRIERYIKSKSSLAIKDITEPSPQNKYLGNARNSLERSKEVSKIQEKRPSIVEQKIEESMQTIDAGKKQEEKPKKGVEEVNEDGYTKEEAAYFATEII